MERQLSEEEKAALAREIKNHAQKRYYDANKEKVLAGQKKYQQTNAEKVKEAKKARYMKNREGELERKREYRRKNKEAIAERDRQRRLENADAIRAAKTEFARRQRAMAKENQHNNANEGSKDPMQVDKDDQETASDDNGDEVQEEGFRQKITREIMEEENVVMEEPAPKRAKIAIDV